ncbi:MAG: hypothetical protein HKN21_08940 [Candidatus Eisenbacteria bacterium]|uniref:Uncharacterized protein n=1 Tax=Eiseniibacteriota bacterium TaxID=2212470 RepID=A0A7Y2H2A1_UNCEI|nr:hypothetical protein [Candidatus Eisenbacteria bacterium]
MARFFRISLVLAIVGMFAATAAMANIPDPALSNCPAFLTITPDGSFTYTVTVNGATGPVNGSLVEIRVSAQADPVVCWCVGQVHPSITAVTNASGEADFNIAGGGCVSAAGLGGGAVVAQVLADGIELCQIEINSPDAVDSGGFLPTDDDYVGDANCVVGLADAVFHTGPIAGGTAEVCSNFTDPYDDTVALGDAVIVTPYIVNGTSCVAQ